jgi:hypothetical protein
MTIHDETGHDQHVDASRSIENLEPTAATTDYSTDHTPPPVEPVVAQRDSFDQDRVAAEPSSEKSLFPADDLSGLRARWDDVQAGFVDDPKACVQKADGLVSDVVDQLTSSFSAARARLEEQWARGEDASTEDLRLALKRYREFFQKLLSV